MLIDWFTFIAQIINFLVLIWLLKRFLYKPILNAIDEREKRIAAQIQEAETLKKEATGELENFQQKNKELDHYRQELLSAAKSEVDSERQRLLEQTRSDIEKLRSELQNTIRNEQEKLGSEIVHRTRKEIFSVARKTLHDLASVSLEDQMANVFVDRIKNLAPDEKELLRSGISQVQSKIIMRCTFELSPNQQTKVEEILKKEFGRETKVNFEIMSNLISGFELIAGGYKLVWSIDDYLESLEKSISELLTVKV